MILNQSPQPPEATMRKDRIIQAGIFDLFSQHEIGRELKAMSAWLTSTAR